MMKRCKTGGKRGFTLLELMISIFIVAIIAVIIFSAFRISIRAWEKGTGPLEENQQFRAVYDILRRQLTSTVTNEITNNRKKPYFLKGDETSLVFITRVPVTEVVADRLTIVKYKVQPENGGGGKNLLYFEKDAVLKIPGIDEEESKDEKPFLLLSHMDAISFEYLKQGADSEMKWQESWNPDEEGAFPLAVRVTLKPMGERAPVTLVARIH